jgi:GntR family transcriptional regulator
MSQKLTSGSDTEVFGVGSHAVIVPLGMPRDAKGNPEIMEDAQDSYGGSVASIDHDSGESVPSQLATILREKIASGEITGRVPSGLTLAQEYGISHGSAERALKILKDEGLIYAVVGKGAYVKRS